MNIPKDTLSTWGTLREHGDIPKLVKLTGLSRSSLYNLFIDGECTPGVAAKLLKFYAERQAIKDSVQKQLEDQD